MQEMTSSRPYLIRAIYDWIVDNYLTPYLLVNAEAEGVVVPEQYIEDGKIILNINPSAVHGLQLGNDAVMFSARFSGQSMDLMVPITAVMAIYARENGRGMVFNEEVEGTRPPTPDGDGPDKGKKPALKLVK